MAANLLPESFGERVWAQVPVTRKLCNQASSSGFPFFFLFQVTSHWTNGDILMPLCSFVSQPHINPRPCGPAYCKQASLGGGGAEQGAAVVPSQRLAKDSATFRCLSLSRRYLYIIFNVRPHISAAARSGRRRRQQQRLLLSSRGALHCWQKMFSSAGFSLYFPMITRVSVQYERGRSRWYLKIYADVCSVVIVALAQSLKRLLLYLVILFFFLPPGVARLINVSL